VALLARLCVYHRTDDDLLLVFPMIYFARRAWVRAGDWSDWVAVAALMASVWVPTRWAEQAFGNVVVVAIWVALIGKLLCNGTAPEKAKGVTAFAAPNV
jgi:hypothetical protein